ncbi:MAG: shikimate kinase [Spirochaetes bacterium]|nr:shikimate kinase [Spirochaetota bacterium]
MKHNIVLIGYRGTGKTVLASGLAELMGMDLMDTDQWIVQKEGRSIPEIFDESGEKYFRDLETESVKEINRHDNTVIATGGGIIGRGENIEFLKESGFVVWLQADVDVIYKRIYKDSNRPSLTRLDPKKEIEHLLENRNPIYKKTADFSLDTGKFGVDECLKIIEEEYRKYLGYENHLI